jgi:amino acid transporter
MAAAETKNPRHSIPRACKRVFARVSIFYVLAVLVVGMLVRSDDEKLGDESGTAAQSPFVIAASAAGLQGIPSLVNAIVITSAWSSSNQALLSGTRVLYGLALKKQAPQFFLKTTFWGVPYYCVLLQFAFMFLAFMSLSDGALTVFWWLVDLVACGVLISWISILFNHLRLMLAMKKQGLPLSSLPWHSRWTGKFIPAKLINGSNTDCVQNIPHRQHWSCASSLSSPPASLYSPKAIGPPCHSSHPICKLTPISV